MNQGTIEVVAYGVDFTAWGSSPVNPLVSVFQGSTGSWSDVTSQVITTGSASFLGNIVNLPPIRNIKEAQGYRVRVTATLNGGAGNTESPYFDIIGEF
jgi:hypothetical protein